MQSDMTKTGQWGFSWKLILQELEREVSRFELPVIAGYLQPGFDLDVFVVVQRVQTGYGPTIEVAQRCAEIAARHQAYVFRTFRQLSSVVPDDIIKGKAEVGLLHLHLYPDIESARRWEKGWILNGIIAAAHFWKGGPLAYVVANGTRREGITEKLAWYRRVVAEGMQNMALGLPTAVRARFDASYRMRLVAKHALRELQSSKTDSMSDYNVGLASSLAVIENQADQVLRGGTNEPGLSALGESLDRVLVELQREAKT